MHHPIYSKSNYSTFSKKTSDKEHRKLARLPAAPKQLLSLRSDIPSLFSPIFRGRTPSSGEESPSPPHQLALEKFHLKFIEKENRKPSTFKNHKPRQMKAAQRTNAYDLMNPAYGYLSGKGPTTSAAARTPSSGFSSCTSSENMISGLSIGSSSEEERRLHDDILDPSVEVDLDVFLTSAPQQARHQMLNPKPNHLVMNNVTQRAYQQQQQQQAPMIGSQPDLRSFHQNQHHAKENFDFMRSSAPFDQFNGNTGVVQQQQVRQQQQPQQHGVNNWVNWNNGNGNQEMWHSGSSGVATSSSAGSQQSQPLSKGCNYCWESYVKTCNKVANADPMFPVDGPWNWHTLYDRQGRVTCPRLWFVQLDRAGSDMLEQMAHKRQETYFC